MIIYAKRIFPNRSESQRFFAYKLLSSSSDLITTTWVLLPVCTRRMSRWPSIVGNQFSCWPSCTIVPIDTALPTNCMGAQQNYFKQSQPKQFILHAACDWIETDEEVDRTKYDYDFAMQETTCCICLSPIDATFGGHWRTQTGDRMPRSRRGNITHQRDRYIGIFGGQRCVTRPPAHSVGHTTVCGWGTVSEKIALANGTFTHATHKGRHREFRRQQFLFLFRPFRFVYDLFENKRTNNNS